MQRTCLVTGASRGIGAAIADKLAADGHFVVGTATTQEGAARISTRLAAAGARGAGMVLDVSSSASIDALLEAIAESHGVPLILVNNAGITQDNLLMRMKDAEWDKVIDTNLGSIYRLSKAVLRGMTKARWGRIVNVSSVVASMGNGGQTNYAASKAGMEGFSRSLAREIGSRGITVNCVAPGFIDTDMTRELPESNRAKLLEQISLGRLGDAAEVAAVVAFLASESAGYVTGETVHVNGGLYMC
jgi:3-oxoacyl-[acyl-carrier protein] reductase